MGYKRITYNSYFSVLYSIFLLSYYDNIIVFNSSLSTLVFIYQYTTYLFSLHLLSVYITLMPQKYFSLSNSYFTSLYVILKENAERKIFMAKITSDMAICAYKIVNDVFNNKLSRTEGNAEIALLSGMGVGSARD